MGAINGSLFRCVGRDERGRRRHLTLNAKTRTAALAAMRREGLAPLDAQCLTSPTLADQALSNPTQGAASARVSPKPAAPSSTLSQKNLTAMVTRLATLLERGISAERSFLILSRDPNPTIAQTGQKIRAALREGDRLTDAMRDAGQINDPMLLALTAAGETSGALATCLREADRLLSGRARVLRSLTSALIYPAILMVVAFASIALVMLVIIPEFRPLLDGRMAEVPLLGQAIFAFSASLDQVFPWLIAISLLVIALTIQRVRQGQFERLIARIPGLAASLSEAQTSLVLRILGTLLERDVPLDKALKVAALSTRDFGLLERLRNVSAQIIRGKSIYDAFAEATIAPAAALELIRIGDETGDLAPMFKRAAEDLEEASQARLHQIVTLAEPVIIIVIGSIIGVSLYALFTAIMAVNAIDL